MTTDTTKTESSNLLALPHAPKGAWKFNCGECRYVAAEPYCPLFDKRLSRDVVGLRLRLPECRSLTKGEACK